MKQVGLEPLQVGADDLGVLRSTLYGYLQGEIPVLLGVKLRDTRVGTDNYHAIAVTGFSLGGTLVPTGTGFKLRAQRIDKLYAHDDGVGPFSRLTFAAQDYLLSSWHLRGPDQVHPQWMLVPLYHKIRIPFDCILAVVRCFDAFLRTLTMAPQYRFACDLEWDVFLTSISDFRAQVLGATELSGAARRGIIQQPLPRFLWRAIGRDGSKQVLEVVFDGTDIERGGNLFLQAVEYDGTLCEVLRGICKGLDLGSLLNAHPDWAILEQIIGWFQK
jgi:hypothetical protein